MKVSMAAMRSLTEDPEVGVLGQTGGSSVWFAEVARMDDYRDL